MAISLKGGSIYFLRERDYLSGEISPYVKIGLVRDNKPTEERIAEHQTGNPRQILDYETLGSPFVEYLETQLHYRFASRWISGEWFLLDQEGLRSAVSEAESLISEFRLQEETIVHSMELSKKSSTAAEREPNEKERSTWEELCKIKLRKDELEARKIILKSKLSSKLSSASSIEGVISVISNAPGPSFDVKLLADAHPEIYQTYLNLEKTALSGSFSIRGKKQLKDENPSLYEATSDATKQAKQLRLQASKDSIERDNEIEKLHAEYIDIQRDLYINDWEYQTLEAQLKVSVDETEGLIGLCGWKRTMQTKTVFNQSLFKSERADLYEEFLVTRKPTVAVSINTWRPYHFET